VMTIIPLIGNDYGPAGAWCWVQSETTAGKVKLVGSQVQGSMIMKAAANVFGCKGPYWNSRSILFPRQRDYSSLNL
jgi:hypothetical protein